MEYKSFMYFIDPSFRYDAKLRPVEASTVYYAKENRSFPRLQLPKSAW